MAPIKQRQSRRLRGERPEFEPYSTERNLPECDEDDEEERTEMTTTGCQHIRHPAVFSGDTGRDPQKWLKEYERISKFNKWDDTVSLANVFFYLEGTARQWYENNEEKLTSWEAFKAELQKYFGDAQRQKSQAEERLKCRAQRPTETTKSYIQDVLELCKTVDPRMKEDEKVAHLMKGVAEEMYQGLLLKEISTVEDFIKCCQHIEAMHQRRIGRKKFQRLPNVVSIAEVGEDTDLTDVIRQIVREEIQRALGVCVEPHVDTLQEIIREEVQQTLAPISRRPTPPKPAKQQRPRRVYAPETQRDELGYAPRKTDVWRTEDNQPVCFHCGRPGHVVRYCRERRQIFNNVRDSRRQMEMNRRQPYDDETGQEDAYTRRPRSPSPQASRSRGRSPTCRTRSPSPFRSSSRSPSRRSLEN